MAKNSKYTRLFALVMMVVPLLGMAGDKIEQKKRIEGVEVEAKFSRDSIIIGDQIDLVLKVKKDVAQRIALPEITTKATEGAIEVVGKPRIDTLNSNGRNVELQVSYTITSFDKGAYTIAPLPFLLAEKNITDTLFSDSLRLFVDSYVIDTASYVLHDIKPRLGASFTFDEAKYYGKKLLTSPLTYLILAIIALIIFITWWIVTRKRRRVEIRPQIPAHIVAIDALTELDKQKLWQSGKHKLYYTRLSDILRVYLSQRYGVNGMEMTSDEIFASLRNLELQGSDFELIERFLSLSDFVKFAKLSPSPEENQDSYHDVYNFVEKTKLIEAEEVKNGDENSKIEEVK